MSQLEDEEIENTHHLETVRPINHEQHQVGDLPNVDHRVQIVIALNKRKTLLLATDDRDGPLDMVKRLLGITSDQTLHQSCFPDSGRTNNGYDDRWRLVFRSSVNQRNMEASLVPLDVSATLPLSSATRPRRESLRNGQ